MQFKEWLNITESSSRSYAKLGLYTPTDALVGPYPPLWGTPKAADLITYYSMHYPNGVPGKNGIMWFADPPAKNGITYYPQHQHQHQQRYVKYNLPPA